MIDGPFQKRRSAPVAGGETPTAKSPRPRSAPQQGVEPEPSEALRASEPTVAVTHRAMRAPEVTTSHKRRYPHAPPFDFDTAKETRFLRDHARHLNEKLQAAHLNRGDLIGAKRQGVLHNVGRAHSNFTRVREGLLEQFRGGPSSEEVDAALERLMPAVARRNAAVGRHAEAESKLVKARLHGDATDVDAAQKEVEQARQTRDGTQAALLKAIPPWARSNEAHAPLIAAAESRLTLTRQVQQVAKTMRVLWLRLGEHAFTKLPHFTAGAFGKVALAMRSNGTLCALKVMRTTSGRNPGGTQTTDKAQAQREAGLMQRYYDPSVRLHQDPQTQKLILEMPLALGSLDTLTSHPNVPLVRSTGRQVFLQLIAMHADGVVHNDLKPENIIVHSDGRVLPADFGLASNIDEGAAIGTPAYAAPEHCPNHLGMKPGVATDVWSAGLSLAAAYVPIQGSPFAVTDIKDMQQTHSSYEAWRSKFKPAADDTLGPRLAEDAGDPFSAFFAQLHQIDPALCGYLLTRVLVPAAERATALEAHTFFETLQPANAPQERALAQQLTSRESTPYRRAAQLALQTRFDIEAGATRGEPAR